MIYEWDLKKLKKESLYLLKELLFKFNANENEIKTIKTTLEILNSMLEETKPIGKKMDFLIQEMNRETNTTGSKSGSLEITNTVINIKTELEDIREQVQNIE